MQDHEVIAEAHGTTRPARPPRIETERLVLREMVLEDAPAIQEIFSDFAVTRWLSLVPHPYPEGEAIRYVEACSGFYVWAIEARDRPGLIGMVGIDSPEDKRALGYWVGRSHWGLGVASEASEAAVRFAFEDMAADQVVSGVFEGNEASIRIQEKLGFRVIGERMLHSFSNNREMLHIDTALSRAEWQMRARG
ncbi:MAG: GNAT family N-acetyltransferase [Pseudomonadota bacterium]